MFLPRMIGSCTVRSCRRAESWTGVCAIDSCREHSTITLPRAQGSSAKTQRGPATAFPTRTPNILPHRIGFTSTAHHMQPRQLVVLDDLACYCHARLFIRHQSAPVWQHPSSSITASSENLKKAIRKFVYSRAVPDAGAKKPRRSNSQTVEFNWRAYCVVGFNVIFRLFVLVYHAV